MIYIRLLLLSGRECFLDIYFFGGEGEEGLFAFFWFYCCKNCCKNCYRFYYYKNNLSKTSIFYKTHYSLLFFCFCLVGFFCFFMPTLVKYLYLNLINLFLICLPEQIIITLHALL